MQSAASLELREDRDLVSGAIVLADYPFAALFLMGLNRTGSPLWKNHCSRMARVVWSGYR